MPDSQPPRLPDSAPRDLRDFIACKRASVTISGGPLDWLPLPPDLKDYAPTPTLALEPGATGGSGTITLDFGVMLKVSLPASISGGELHIDGSGVSAVPGAQEVVDSWVVDFNAFLKANGQRLKDTSIRGGSLTLTKEPIPPTDHQTDTGAVAGGATGAAGTPPKPIPPPPIPPTGPATDEPSDNKGCWLLGLLGLGLVTALGLAVVGGVIKLPGGTGETPDAPSTSPTTAATSPSPTSPPTATPEPTPEPPPTGTQGIVDIATELGIITSPQVPGLTWHADATGDFFLPQPGQPPTQRPAEIDLQQAAGFAFTLDAAAAAALSDMLPCDTPWTSATGTVLDVACNQDQPLAAGGYHGLMTTHAGGYPTDYPTAGLHSWSVFSDADHDPTTGFSSGSPDNFLIGADDYMEMLAFESQGESRNYVLATRMSDPVRPDTGQRQGNLPTTARVIWDRATGSMLWLLPNGDFAGDWNVGAFATTDRAANSPETLAADALGNPGDLLYRMPLGWDGLEG